jgi:phosphatidyl-myo-inositol alpha-mannosyltransferase
MKISFTHPFCWPHVRRGSERQIEIIADWLGSRGHDVTYYSTHPEHATVEKMAYGRRVLARARCGVRSLRIDERHTFLWTAFRQLRRDDAQVIHSFYYTDSLAASACRARTARVLQLHGVAIPGVSCRRFVPPEASMLRSALKRADAVVTCSAFIGDLIEQHYGVRPRVIASAVDQQAWPLGYGPPDGRPVILAAADFTVRRKGVRPLVRAFALLLEAEPGACLRLSGNMPDELREELRSLVPDSAWKSIEVLGLGRLGDLILHYQQASVLALPAMWEPSAGSMMEALSCGTPVVATAHGGLPEYLNPAISVTFDPQSDGEETGNIEGLAQALHAGLRLSRQPGIRQRCRAHAALYAMDIVGIHFEGLYASLQ